MKFARGLFCVVQHHPQSTHSMVYSLSLPQHCAKFHLSFNPVPVNALLDKSSAIVCVQMRIAYAQIGRKLFSCSDDNVAFPRSWVISLRDLKLYVFFSPFFLFLSLSFMGVLWNSVQVKQAHCDDDDAKMREFGEHILPCGRNGEKCILFKRSHIHQSCPCIALIHIFFHTNTKGKKRILSHFNKM